MVAFLSAIGAINRYSADAVNFDGTNDWLTRGAGLTGAVDGKSATVSLWLRAGADNVELGLFSIAVASTSNRFLLFRTTDENLRLTGRNSSGTTIVDYNSSIGSAAVAAEWVHFLASFDLTNSSNRHLYIDDAEDLDFVTTYTNDIVDFATNECLVGRLFGGQIFNGDMADLMVWPGVYVDLSVEANRRLFISSMGKPVNPHVAIATLGTPIIRLSGPSADWHTNKGSGGGFTENGALTDAATSPSD